MDTTQILEQVNKIFIDVLDDDDIKLTGATTASDVDGWDSLNHIQLIVAIEKHFRIRFSSLEIQRWNNVEDMINNIDLKINV